MSVEFLKRMWSSHSKTISFVGRLTGTLISTVLFFWLISRQNWGVIVEKALGIAIWAVLLFVGLYLLSYGFNNLRWCILLWAQGIKISFGQAYCISWAGIFTSNFLPGTIGGDGFRMLAIHKYSRRTTISIGSVVLDRIINLAAMVCLIPAPLMIFGTSMLLRTQSLPEGNSHSMGLFPAGGICHGVTEGRVAATLIPLGLQKLFERYFPKIVAAVRQWGSKPTALFYSFLAAWPSNLLPMAATYLIARQLGMNVTYWQVISVQTVTYFLSLLPISVNGYGLREVAYTTLYAMLGSTLEQASTLALVTRFLIVLSTLPGTIWLSSSLTGEVGPDKKLEL